MRTHSSLLTAAALTILAAPTVAQQPAPTGDDGVAVTAFDANTPVLEAFSLRAARVQSIHLPPVPGDALDVPVEINGVTRVLALRKHSVYARHARIQLDDGKSLVDLPVPETTTYQGAIAGIPGSAVAAQILDGQIWATVFMADGATWGVQPVSEQIPATPATAHVIYRKGDTKLPPDLACGVENGPVAPIEPAAEPNALRRVQVGIDIDVEYVRRYGSPAAAQTQMQRVINGTDVIYKRDVEICIAVSYVIIRSTAVYAGTTTGTRLNEMRTRWQTPPESLAAWDIGHLFTGVGAFSGVIGTAFLTVVCSRSAGFGVSKAFHSNLATNVGLVAHEMGHNWSAQHCNSSPPCYIMCSSIGGCNGNVTLFGNAAKAQILAHKNSRTCLDTQCGGCPPAAAVNYGTACLGTVRGPADCGSLNPSATANTTTLWVGNAWFAHRVPPSSSSRTVVGADFLCRSTTTTQNLTIGLFLSNGAAPASAPVRTATMAVTTASGFRGNSWAPIVIPANTLFFIAYRTPPTTTFQVESATGATGTYYWNGPTWSGPWTNRRFGWKVRCTGAGNPLPPLISGTTPRIGGTWTTSLSQARPISPSVLVLGVGRIALPLPLTNSCTLYVNPLISFPGNTSTTGTRSLTLGIANNASFCGAKLTVQYIVRDNPPGNLLGWVTTQGREGTLGS